MYYISPIGILTSVQEDLSFVIVSVLGCSVFLCGIGVSLNKAVSILDSVGNHPCGSTDSRGNIAVDCSVFVPRGFAIRATFGIVHTVSFLDVDSGVALSCGQEFFFRCC